MWRKGATIIAAIATVALGWLTFDASANSSDLEARLGACHAPANKAGWQSLKQGWTDEAEQRFWFTSQGSQVLPYDWFMALEQPHSKAPFHDRANLESFGFIAAPVSACNPDGLPIGFALDNDTGSIGLTCAACHTRRLDYAGRSILVNGAPADIDFGLFVDRLADALEYTLSNPQAWDRFRKRVGATRESNDGLVDAAAERLLELRKFQRFIAANGRDHGLFAGNGRVDAFGAIFNKITVEELRVAENYAPADAPVSYPFIWGAARGTTTQWNGTAPNAVPFGPLARNLGVGLGLFGRLDIDDSKTGFSSSAKIANLQQLEKLTEALRAPVWPANVLPPVDKRLAAAGEVQYQQQCAGCHERIQDQTATYSPRLVAIDEIGTDSLAATNYFGRTAKTGVLEGRKKWIIAGDTFGATAPSREIVVAGIVGVILNNGIYSVGSADLAALLRKRPVVPGPAYKARPLNGIWATAPYLHNGSVPTLRDLLESEQSRPAQFAVEQHAFDPIRVGLVYGKSRANAQIFDTRARGNSNAGHNYGTDLSDADKLALLEFLKTL
jgi:mono/diheme cytochrome c family protein